MNMEKIDKVLRKINSVLDKGVIILIKLSTLVMSVWGALSIFSNLIGDSLILKIVVMVTTIIFNLIYLKNVKITIQS